MWSNRAPDVIMPFMDNSAENKITIKTELVWAALLMLFAFALRLGLLGSLPFGLNQDEASAGYDAWALLNFGVDRCGNHFPVLLESWGSGQNALMSYLAMPFIALFGLSEASLRLVNALFGCAALVFFWLLARRMRGPAFGLCALFFLTICPWHIMASRWALESNLLPTFLLAGIYFTARAREKEWSLLPAAVFFGLCLYSYGTAFFFLPPFLVFAVIWLRKRLRPISFLISLGVFVIIALPISLCQVRNALGLPETVFLGLTLPALTETRQAATSLFGGGGFSAALENFKNFLGILLKQTDGLPYNAAASGGLYYFFGLPLAAVGVAASFLRLREYPDEAPVLAALVFSFLCAFFIDVNVNRINMLWLPLVYFVSLGLYFVLCKLRKWGIIPLAGILVSFFLFLSSYTSDFGGDGSPYYYPGLGEAIKYVADQDAESVFVTYYVNQPYIFALFYEQISPEDFINSVDYVNPNGAFRWVSSFGSYRFGYAENAEGEYLILHRSEAVERDVTAAFGEFVVCAG
ncbi:MAG: hypothetical protein EOM54_07870 [Clostridia bacterium]|nr:hypothetical protein [Clostridia bacterium]